MNHVPGIRCGKFYSLKSAVIQNEGTETPARKQPKRRKKTDSDMLEIRTYLNSSMKDQSFVDSIPSKFISKNLFPPEALYAVTPKVASKKSVYAYAYILCI